MSDNHLCKLRLKLVDDEPGQHTYVHACQDCNREYGPEFVVYHASVGGPSEPVPLVSPEVCHGCQDAKFRWLSIAEVQRGSVVANV
jgi:hypothetical protein